MSVIIVGGGMVGATLALAISTLTHGTMSVDLIEMDRRDNHIDSSFDARVIALAHGTCQQLIRIGIWSALSDCATAITHVHVSDRGYPGCVNLRAQDYKITALGQVIELHEATRRLFSLLEKAPGVTVHCPARVIDVIRSDAQIEVLLNNSMRISGELLVAADGSRSMLSHACNVRWEQHDYPQCATIANITTSEDPKGRAFERFTRYGPLAMLPISKGRSSLVWCHAREEQNNINSWDDQCFISVLQKVFGWRMGRILKAGKRHSFFLSQITTNKHVSHRLALVGNAAQTLHPIAGQGFNIGFRDVMSLAETLAIVAHNGEDPGSYACLNHYQKQRKQDQQDTVRATDGLIRLFANDYGLLVVSRNLGLLAMARLPEIRAAFIKHALGWVRR